MDPKLDQSGTVLPARTGHLADPRGICAPTVPCWLFWEQCSHKITKHSPPREHSHTAAQCSTLCVCSHKTETLSLASEQWCNYYFALSCRLNQGPSTATEASTDNPISQNAALCFWIHLVQKKPTIRLDLTPWNPTAKSPTSSSGRKSPIAQPHFCCCCYDQKIWNANSGWAAQHCSLSTPCNTEQQLPQEPARKMQIKGLLPPCRRRHQESRELWTAAQTDTTPLGALEPAALHTLLLCQSS